MLATSVFLIPNGTFVVELAVVLVILFLVTKYILPPLNAAMEARQEKIRTALEAADKARAEAAAAAGVVSCGGGVDPWNPKVVRASAGAVFGVPLVEEEDPVQIGRAHV